MKINPKSNLSSAFPFLLHHLAARKSKQEDIKSVDSTLTTTTQTAASLEHSESEVHHGDNNNNFHPTSQSKVVEPRFIKSVSVVPTPYPTIRLKPTIVLTQDNSRNEALKDTLYRSDPNILQSSRDFLDTLSPSPTSPDENLVRELPSFKEFSANGIRCFCPEGFINFEDAQQSLNMETLACKDCKSTCHEGCMVHRECLECFMREATPFLWTKQIILRPFSVQEGNAIFPIALKCLTKLAKSSNLRLRLRCLQVTENGICWRQPAFGSFFWNGKECPHPDDFLGDRGLFLDDPFKFNVIEFRQTGYQGREETYIAAVYLVKIKDHSKIVKKIEMNSPSLQRAERSAKKQFRHNEDSVVTFSSECPLSGEEIGMPVKGAFCEHFQNFSLQPFLEANSESCAWQCPLCQRPAHRLVSDPFFKWILLQMRENVSFSRRGFLFADGSFSFSDQQQISPLPDKAMVYGVQPPQELTHITPYFDLDGGLPVEGPLGVNEQNPILLE